MQSFPTLYRFVCFRLCVHIPTYLIWLFISLSVCLSVCESASLSEYGSRLYPNRLYPTHQHLPCRAAAPTPNPVGPRRRDDEPMMKLRRRTRTDCDRVNRNEASQTQSNKNHKSSPTTPPPHHHPP